MELHKRNAGMLVNALFAVALLLGAGVIVKVGGLLALSRQAEGVGALAFDPNRPGDADPNGPAAERTALVERLEKENLFVKPAPKQHPVREVAGILGDEALINNRWYKLGDSVGDAKIVAIEPTKVRIAWNGQEKDFAPMGTGGSGGPPGPRGARPPGRPGGPPAAVRGGRPRRGGPPRPMPSPQERAALRERFRNMSGEEREQFREKMRERFERRAR